MSRARFIESSKFGFIRSRVNNCDWPDDYEMTQVPNTPNDVQALSRSEVETWFRHYGAEASDTAFQKEKLIAFMSGQDLDPRLL
ncbi:hypothetical protein L198_05385 [Cryptococcus wingfieldii CBS 7118]|uniref:Uncharacterized protein n=1 Tax=Cryptococcus wingfieldii CBS 7118 TaxID=1295528 RepID=A0A1E3IY25_9TREE|nr:hypothetical protein L198_05385 [Cryptococcus wingfieldii CBS 7118]ODN93520.1 hypothetical protein L198_05385 [Cryptococcus wingfieldii CBS 7118]